MTDMVSHVNEFVDISIEVKPKLKHGFNVSKSKVPVVSVVVLFTDDDVNVLHHDALSLHRQ